MDFPRFNKITEQTRRAAKFVSLQQVIDEITIPEPKTVGLIDQIRAAKSKREREQFKVQLPAFRFSSMSLSTESARPHKVTGFICLDVDRIAEQGDIEEYRKTVAMHPSTAMAFLSPSGTGLKILVDARGIVNVPRDFDDVYKSVAYVYSLLLGGIPITRKLGPHFDPAMKSPQQMTYVSHDPDAYYNLSSECIRFWPSLKFDYDTIAKLDPDDYTEWAGHGAPRLKRVLTRISPEIAYMAFRNFSRRAEECDPDAELRRKWDEDFVDIDVDTWMEGVEFSHTHPRAILETLEAEYGVYARYHGDFHRHEVDFDTNRWPDAEPNWHELDPDRDLMLIRGVLHETAMAHGKPYQPSAKNIEEALKTAHVVHPLRDYLSSLSPSPAALENPEAFIISNIIRLLGLNPDDPLHQFVALTIPCAMIMYAFNASRTTLCDVMPILIGDQGSGKNLFLNGLLPDHMQEYINPGLQSDYRTEADLVQACDGRVLVVCDELVGLDKKSRAEFRNLISRTEWNVRFAHGRATKRIVRTCLFVGSVNPDADYVIPDDPNSRRAILVPVNPPPDAYGTLMRGAMLEIVDDLLAAAMLIARHKTHIIAPPTLYPAIESSNKQYIHLPPFVDEIMQNEMPDAVSVEDVWFTVFPNSMPPVPQQEAKLIRKALRYLGYRSSTKVERWGPEKKPQRIYRRALERDDVDAHDVPDDFAKGGVQL